MKNTVCIIGLVLLLTSFSSLAQKTKMNVFHAIEVPDSISKKLDQSYKLITGFDNVNAGKNVWNLIDKDDLSFKDGLYSFKGQGPHFPRLLFICHNGVLFVFTGRGVNKVLLEYSGYIESCSLTEGDKVSYLKEITKYLEDELDETYGDEMRK